MERLTYKNYIDEYEVEFEKTSEKQWSLAESDTHIKITGEPIDRLAEFEDFMEEIGLETFEQLKEHIYYDYGYTQSLITENQALKDFNSRLQNINIELLNQKQILLDRWKKLKEFAKIEHDWGLDENYQDHSYAMKLVFDRMEELEKE